MHLPKILVVEDESIVAMDLKQRLVAMDYEVTATVSSGAAAIEQVATCLPELVLMDIQIKGDIDGIETAKQIQEQFDIPIVFLTANSDIATVERAKKTEPLAYLLKPFEDRDLLTTIEIALHRYKLESELRRSEQALRDSEKRYRGLVESTNDWIWEMNIEGVYIYASPQIEATLGYKPEEVVGKTPFDLMPPEEAVRIAGIFKDIAEKGESIVALENVNLHKDGRRIVLETSGVPVLDAAGNVTGYRGVDRDITERKQAEEARYNSEKKYRDLVEKADIGVIIDDSDNSFTYFNDTFAIIFGYTRAEMKQLTFNSLVAPEFLERRDKAEYYRHLHRGESSSRYEFEGIKKDGTLLYLEVDSIALKEGNKVTGWRSYVRDITERKRAEEEIQRTKEFLDSIIENIPNMIFIKEAKDLKFVRMNKAGEELLGYSHEEMLGKNDYDFYPIDQADFFIAKDREVLRSNKLLDIPEEPIVTKNKGSRILHTKKIPLHNEKGEPQYLLGISEDITDRKVIEQKLKASESWLQAVLKSIGDAVIATDQDNRIVFMNPVAENLTGWTAGESELIDSDEILNLVSGESGQAIESPIRKCLQDGSVVGGTSATELIGRSDYRIPIEDSAAPIHDDKGNLVGGVMVFRDVTKSRDAEKKIITYQDQLKKLLTIRTGELDETMANLSQETTRRYRAEEEVLDLSKFPDESPDPIMRISKDGIMVYANKASVLILDSWKCKINQLVPEKWMKVVSEAFTSGSHSDIEIKVESRIYSLVVAPIVSSGYVNLYGKDITFQKQSEEKEHDLQDRLERAERMKALGLLAGGVAHDLNNMLGPLVGYPELILRKLSDDSPIRKQIERIGSSAKDAASVIQDLLTLARRGRYDMEPINPNQMITAYFESPSFENIAHEHPGIRLVTDFEPDLPLIKGSSPHLSKVIMNLIVNAIDAMKDTGTLTIETRREQIDKLISGYSSINPGEYVILTVRDTGCGIRPEDLNKIFEPYYSNKEMQGSSGSGLGLSVVYGIVKDHGGYYDIISEVGNGTEFILYFPITLDTPADSEVLVAHPGGHETVLVVDDNEGQRELARDFLSSLGYEVILAKNGTEAVSIIQKRSAELVVLDMIMEEGFDGLDTYREILKYQPRQKAIIVSGFSSTTRVDEAQKIGVGAYIRKPFDLATIASAVRNELDKTIKVTVN